MMTELPNVFERGAFAAFRSGGFAFAAVTALFLSDVTVKEAAYTVGSLFARLYSAAVVGAFLDRHWAASAVVLMLAWAGLGFGLYRGCRAIEHAIEKRWSARCGSEQPSAQLRYSIDVRTRQFFILAPRLGPSFVFESRRFGRFEVTSMGWVAFTVGVLAFALFRAMRSVPANANQAVSSRSRSFLQGVSPHEP